MTRTLNMTRTLTILAAAIALAVTAGPAAAYSMSSGGDRPMESLSFTKAPPMPRGEIVVTKPTDIASTKPQRGSSVSGLQDTLITSRSTKARSGKRHKGHNGGQGTVTASWDLTSSAKV